MRKSRLALFVLSILVTTSASAHAMGSGDKYQDLQTGVTYVIYKPTNTLKLPVLNFEVRPCRLFPKKDEYLLAGFGGMDHGIALVETDAKYNCTGVDHPKPVLPRIVQPRLSANMVARSRLWLPSEDRLLQPISELVRKVDLASSN